MNGSLHIRAATPDDAAELLKIYEPYVRQTAITFEYNVPTVTEFKDRIKNTLSKYPYIVALRDNEIVGYAYAGEFKSRQAYDWAVETSVYVKMTARRSGIGKLLYSTLEKVLAAQGFLNMNACIAFTEKNDAHLTPDSVYFHEKLGFQYIGIFHQCGYKFDRWYDMIWMEKHIGKHTDKPAPIKPFNKADFEF